VQYVQLEDSINFHSSNHSAVLQLRPVVAEAYTANEHAVAHVNRPPAN
jgi:hypothetical protein